MSFSEEIHDYVRKHNKFVIRIKAFSSYNKLPELSFPSLYIPDKGIVFQLIPIPLSKDITPTYFQNVIIQYLFKGIRVINIWQDQWKQHQEIMRSRIAAILGISQSIHARSTRTQRITKDVARSFLETNHLQGAVSSRHNYGLYTTDDTLVAVASFSGGRSITRYGILIKSYELLRYAGLLHHRVNGGMGKLFAEFLKEIQPDDVMTYVDFEWGMGKGYYALGFNHAATTPPQMFWIHPIEQIRYYQHRLPKDLQIAFLEQTLPIEDFLSSLGYIRIYNAGNLKYIWNPTIVSKLKVDKWLND